MALTPEQDTYLKEHRLAVLATGRKDGSPQVSTIMYNYDGTDIITSVKSFTAKWNNALRQPKVALLINDGRKQLVIYGEAEGIADDPERKELTRRLRTAMGRAPDDEDAFVAQLNKEKRTVLRIKPDKAFMND